MSKVFRGVSVILSGDLLQLPTVQQQQVFTKHKKGECQAFHERCFFHLHELTDIVH